MYYSPLVMADIPVKCDLCGHDFEISEFLRVEAMSCPSCKETVDLTKQLGDGTSTKSKNIGDSLAAAHTGPGGPIDGTRPYWRIITAIYMSDMK